nr:MAG TPA_asm: hypothetical protein [Caudoviricetes sp.]
MIFSNKKREDYLSFFIAGLNRPSKTSFFRQRSRLIISSTSLEEGADLQMSEI